MQQVSTSARARQLRYTDPFQLRKWEPFAHDRFWLVYKHVRRTAHLRIFDEQPECDGFLQKFYHGNLYH